jgi:hypothetical protein
MTPTQAAEILQEVAAQLHLVAEYIRCPPKAQENYRKGIKAQATCLHNIGKTMVTEEKRAVAFAKSQARQAAKQAKVAAPVPPAPKLLENAQVFAMCSRKRGYRTADMALEVAARQAIPLAVYQCPCGAFHLTKNTDPLQTSRHKP